MVNFEGFQKEYQPKNLNKEIIPFRQLAERVEENVKFKRPACLPVGRGGLLNTEQNLKTEHRNKVKPGHKSWLPKNKTTTLKLTAIPYFCRTSFK